MRRRRGEVSLFEILRQPDPAPPETPSEGAAESGGTSEIPGGSTTPPSEPAPRPRLDVTPPSRASRVSRGLPELPDELRSQELVAEELRATTRESGSTAETGPVSRLEWWTRRLGWSPTPILIGLAGLGVVITWVVSFQLGVGSAERDQARRDLFTGEDAPGWEVPILHTTPGKQPEVRNVEGPGGGPAERTPREVADGPQRLPVIMVAQRLGKAENAEALMLHIDSYTEEGFANLTIFRNDYAVFVGPFDSTEEAKQSLARVRKIPTHLGVDFREGPAGPYIHTLEFSPDDLRRLGRD